MPHVLQRGVTGEHHRALTIVCGGRKHCALQHRDRTAILPHSIEHAEKCGDQDEPRRAAAGDDATTKGSQHAQDRNG